MNHDRLLALIAKAGTIPLGDGLTYQEQDEMLNAVGPLIAEARAYLNDLRISNDVGHEWANRAQDRAAALYKIQVMSGLAVSGDLLRWAMGLVNRVATEALGA